MEDITIKVKAIIINENGHNPEYNFFTWTHCTDYSINSVRKMLKYADYVEVLNFDEKTQKMVRLAKIDGGVHELKMFAYASKCKDGLKEQNINPRLIIQTHNSALKKSFLFSYRGYLKAYVKEHEAKETENNTQAEENLEKDSTN